MVLGEVIDSKDFCVMTLFLIKVITKLPNSEQSYKGGNENNNFFTFLYSVAMETENPNLVGQISS